MSHRRAISETEAPIARHGDGDGNPGADSSADANQGCAPILWVGITHTARVHTPLVKGLMRPSAYSHPTRDIRLVETHISWVFLTGDYAHKLKKPVDLGFLDFSTLELRRHFCEEELRLNRRLVPDLYLDVVAIRGSHEAPVDDVNCHAPKHVLEARVFDRAIKGHDVSEADVEILRHQLETLEPVEPKECDLIIDVDTSTDIDLDALVA